MEATYKNIAINDLESIIEQAKSAIEIERLFGPLFPGALEKRYDQWLDNPNDPDTGIIKFHAQNYFTMTPEHKLHCECYSANFEYDAENNEWLELDE